MPCNLRGISISVALPEYTANINIGDIPRALSITALKQILPTF